MKNVSAKSLAQLAANRDTTPSGQSVVKDSTDVLVAAVPTEALAAYTAVIGVVLAANIGPTYGPFRWSAYGAFIALAMLAPLVLFRRRTAATSGGRSLPTLECLTAGVAAAAWGLVMPGSPLIMIFNGNALVFATTAILVGAAAIIGLATQQLGTANSKTPTPKAASEAAAPAPAPAPNEAPEANAAPAPDEAPEAHASPDEAPEANAGPAPGPDEVPEANAAPGEAQDEAPEANATPAPGETAEANADPAPAPDETPDANTTSDLAAADEARVLTS
jgi:hypothetical protein